MKKPIKQHINYEKKKVHIKYLFSDIVKWLYFTRIWLYQRPKFYYLDKEGKKALKEPFLIISNHQGFSDILFVYYPFLTKRIFFMAHQNVFENRFKAFIFRNLLCIPIDPESGSFAALRTLLDIIKKGNVVSVFPEGHINHDSSEVKSFKAGASFLALQSGVDCIQMYREKRAHWWNRQRIIVGKPYNLKKEIGSSFSRNDLDRANQIIIDGELELKRKYQEIVPAKKVRRTNVQVFVSPMPFECSDKIHCKLRKDEINSCGSEKAKNEKFYAWKLLEKALKENYGVDIRKLKFEKQSNGKWICDKFNISFSHSGELVAVAIASYGVGVDIQEIKPLEDIEKLSTLIYGDEEKPDNISENDLIRDWTLKESAFKLSNDTGFNPKQYLLKDINKSETHKIVFNSKEYFISAVGEINDVISFHFLTPDIIYK